MIFKNKSSIFFILISLYIITVSFLWPFIELPISGNTSVGILSQKFVNPLNDTIRFLIFLLPPLIFYIIFMNIYNKDTSSIKSFFYFEIDKNKKNLLEFKDIFLIKFLLIVYVFFEFFYQDFPSTTYLDSLHDGDYLSAFMNVKEQGKYWLSAYTVHGGENFFIPIITNYFLGFSITNLKYTFYVIILLIKILSILLAFQITQISSLDKKLKVIFFCLLSFFILSLSSYTENNYINIRDFFVLIFFIFLINFYLKEKNILNIFFLSICPVFGFLFHFDTGTYMHFIFIIVLANLFFAKKFKLLIMLSVSLIINWVLVLGYFGLQEIKIMFSHFLQLVTNVDYMHGLEFPRPLFSLGDGNDGTRATKMIILILILGFLTINFTFTKKKYLSKNEQILLLIFYIYTVISFKNALGRSDGPHIMLSSDWIVIMLFFYVFQLVADKLKEKIDLKKINFNILFSILFLIIIVPNFNFEKLKNYKSNYLLSKKNDDSSFITDERREIIKKISKIIKNEKCIQNFTGDLSLPYLLKKPNCTYFISPWLASGKKYENLFIEELIKKKVKYIIYNSPIYEVDNIKTSSRLRLVDAYLKNNYKLSLKHNDYILLNLVE